MNAGQLNRRITLQRLDDTEDEWGVPVGWVAVATVWADVRYKSGLETIKSGVEASVTSVSIRIRYRDGVTAGMRALYQNTVFDIRAVLPDIAGHEYLDLVCQQGANNG